YKNADLTLVAGDVNRVREEMPPRPMMARKSLADAESGAGFQEAPLFEYHSYHLERTTTLKDRQTKQLTLLDAKGIPVTKRFLFQPTAYPLWYRSSDHQKNKVAVMLEFSNNQKSNLGMPLPKGVMRVYQDDPLGRMQFIGEDRIDHTPKDEKVKIKLGEAFDVVGDRWQTEYRELGNNQVEASYKISLRNHKEVPVTVTAIEKAGGDWEVTKKSQDFRKTDSSTLEFDVPIPANAERTVTYPVRVKY
ncbi:MAG: DUF4139 domain-containing protein, partial [Bacteroidota bacterium]